MDIDICNLGEVSYRKWHVYDMKWGDEIKDEKYMFCGSSFGGPIAAIPDPRKNLSGFLKIFSSSGRKIAEVPWEGKKLAGMGWSDKEQLIIVLEEGNVIVYNINGKLVKTFLLLDVECRSHIIECHFWGQGVVALTSDFTAYVAEGFSMDLNVLPRKYSLTTGITAERMYTSMAIIPPLLSRSGLLEILLATQDNSIIVVDDNYIEDQHLSERISSPIVKMAVAPNGRFLACYKEDGTLTVLSTTFTSKILDFDTKSVRAPLDIAWCGEDAVLLLWKNMGILMLGPFGDWLNFNYDDDVHLIAESDCCRIITSKYCEILQRVPDPIVAINKIGSTEPAALLFDASEAFEGGDPKSDENIRSMEISGQLSEAVHNCIIAATSEFDINRQQSFMKAASYGKAFCADADPSEFVSAACKLRVLNTVRTPEVGLPLTIQQYNLLTPEVLVGRLTSRNQHFVALKICELLKLKNDSVLINWASEKVKKMALNPSNSDESIRDAIRKKLEPYGRVSFLKIATAAYEMNRSRLATMILDMEQNAAEQVPLLLSMQENELALQKAINSENTDLVYLTLVHLERTKTNMESFYRLIYSHPEAANLLKMYYHNQLTGNDRTALNNLLIFGKNYLDAGFAAIAQAYLHSEIVNKTQLIREASYLFSQSRDLNFHRTATDEQVELIELQNVLEVKSHNNFVGFSLSETLHNLILLNIEKAGAWESEIQKIIKKFKVSEKMVWHIKIQCYSKAGQWQLLSKLALEKKSPVGYRPFALACMKYGQTVSETEKYVDKVTSPEEKFDLFVDLQLWRRAFEVALKMKDPARLEEVGRKCRDLSLESQIQDILSKL